MRIGFDAKRLYNNFTGLGNYSRFVVEALSKFYPENDYLLFTPTARVNSDTQFFLNTKNIQTILPPSWISTMKLNSFWRSFLISDIASRKNLNVYHGLSHELPRGISGKMKTVVTVHDLIFLRYPQFYKSIDVAIYKAKIRYACRVADHIVAISEQTKRDIIEFLRIPSEKISVIYQGCHANFLKSYNAIELDQIRLKYGLPTEYILNVGTIEPRKNALLIVKALKILKDRINIPLVIIGRPTKYLEEIKAYAKQHDLERRVLYIQVDFNDLPAIYRLSKIFVYPSFFEGFGIPLVEAIACEVPVITSTGSCFSEAAGPNSIYVDPMDDEALALELFELLTHDHKRKKMVEQSTDFITKFAPKVISGHLFQLYASLINTA